MSGASDTITEPCDKGFLSKQLLPLREAVIDFVFWRTREKSGYLLWFSSLGACVL